jgi:hypothetical protein
MTYTRPGVYVTESPLRSNVPRGNSAVAVAAFIGTASRGPVTPTFLSSWNAFTAQFGDFNYSDDLSFAVYHYFANGGRNAYVSRVTGAGSTAASVALEYNSGVEGEDPVVFAVLTANNPGEWANNLTVSLSPGIVPSSATDFPSFRLSFSLNGRIVETWDDLSPNPNSNRYFLTVLNNYSAFVVASLGEEIEPVASASYVGLSNEAFEDGGDGDEVENSDYVDAIGLLSDIEGSLIINVVGKYQPAIINAALTQASDRGNSFVIIDPDPAAKTSSEVQAAVSAYSGPTGYGAVYYPMLTMVDPSKSGPAAIRATFPGGAIAGLYVQNDARYTVAKTPAGYNTEILGALGLETRMSDPFVSAVYPLGVNTLKAVPGAGVVVLGGRTLERKRPDKFITVRRTLNFVKQSVFDLTGAYVFAPNNESTWAEIEDRLTNFLVNFWGQGGLKGTTPREAFFVVCDETINTPTTIENGEVNVQVGIALQYPAEFIIVNISQFAGGGTVTEA